MIQPPSSNKRQFIARPFLDGHPISGRVSVEMELRSLIVDRKYTQEKNGALVEKSLRFTPLVRLSFADCTANKQGRDPNRSTNRDVLRSLGTIAVVLSMGDASRDDINLPFISKVPTSSVSEEVKNVSHDIYLELTCRSRSHLSSGKLQLT